ncbi:MAG: GDSL-type esterase/lipase family protein [Myxococcota bacterium]
MRDPHLVVVMLGTNESEFESMNLEEYEDEYEETIQRIRTALPDRSCLVASPPDRAKKNRMGRMTTAPLIPKMVEIQRKVAFRNGCAFWNTYEAMGGKGSMAAWYRNKPRLASGDYTHFTAAGGEVLGILVFEALMEGYEAKPTTAPDAKDKDNNPSPE